MKKEKQQIKKSRPLLANLFDSAPLLTLGSVAQEATYATIHYCIEADDMPDMSESVKIFKNVPAKLIEVSVDEIARAMMSIKDIAEEFKTFNDYHEWYLSHNDMPSYTEKNRWPCIASVFHDEVVQDGSHRMHSYIRAGHKTIPILQYDSKQWWKAHSVWKKNAERRADRSSPAP